MSRNVSISGMVASRQAQSIAGMFERARLRIYSGPRPASTEDPPTGSKLLVEMIFPSAANIRCEGGRITVGPFEEADAVASGKPQWYRVVAADEPSTTILDGDCGDQESPASCQMAHTRIDEGQPCKCSRYIHDVRRVEGR